MCQADCLDFDSIESGSLYQGATYDKVPATIVNSTPSATNNIVQPSHLFNDEEYDLSSDNMPLDPSFQVSAMNDSTGPRHHTKLYKMRNKDAAKKYRER